MAPVGVAVALGVEVAHDVGQGVEHGGAIRKQRRAPRCCKPCQQLVTGAPCAKPSFQAIQAQQRSATQSKSKKQRLQGNVSPAVTWEDCPGMCAIY